MQCLLIIWLALSVTVALSLYDGKVKEAAVLQKRYPKPDPSPVGGKIIQAPDYLALVKKAAQSASKNRSGEEGTSSSQNDRLDEKALKWLDRAEASIYHDADLLAEIIAHYTTKLGTSTDFQRQWQKRKLWTDHLDVPRNINIEALVQEVQSRYLQDWKYHKALGFEQQRLVGPDGVSQETYTNMNDAFRAWSLCNDATATEAERMAKIELLRYGQMADDPNQHQMRKMDVATKAIAWAMKYKKQKQMEEPRGFKRPRDHDT